jgi:hypothetical protein
MSTDLQPVAWCAMCNNNPSFALLSRWQRQVGLDEKSIRTIFHEYVVE